jgi:3-oxoacyl-[acyl-carrier-protein] synthase II
MTLLFEFGKVLWDKKHLSVWDREDGPGGMIAGSAGAFLILESREHAEARGAKPYARINSVMSDRCNRQAGGARDNANKMLAAMSAKIHKGALPVLSGTSGIQPQLTEEHEFLDSLSKHDIQPAIRAATSLFGNTMEAQFPVNVALAALAISKGGFFDPFDESGVEVPWSGHPEQVLISTWGHWRGESLALVDKPNVSLRGVD